MDFFLNNLHKDLRSARLTRRGSTLPENQVPTGLHKKYQRLKKIALLSPSKIDVSLSEALQKRTSYFTGSPEKSLTQEDVSTILGAALKKRDDKTRPYPSGGALYPIETYVLTNSYSYPTFTMYHYDPTDHTLDTISVLPDLFDPKTIALTPKNLEYSTMVIFTSVWKRSSAKYGDFTYTLALNEVGHMSQNILLVAAALGIKARAYAGFDDQKIEELLDLQTNTEQIVHTVLLSK